MTDEERRELHGRLCAHETMLTHLIWRVAIESRHPPSTLSAYLRPLEEKMDAMVCDPQSDPVAMRAARDTVKEIAGALLEALEKEALRRAMPSGQDPS